MLVVVKINFSGQIRRAKRIPIGWGITRSHKAPIGDWTKTQDYKDLEEEKNTQVETEGTGVVRLRQMSIQQRKGDLGGIELCNEVFREVAAEQKADKRKSLARSDLETEIRSKRSKLYIEHPH